MILLQRILRVGIVCAFLSGPMVAEVRTEEGEGKPCGGIEVVPGENWIRFRGKEVVLVGDSLTQGWMELGEEFDQEAYLDALARRGINATLVWSFIGVTDQTGDDRIGYEASEIPPWNRVGGKFDLNSFHEKYFDRLSEFIGLADARGIVVVLTVHDGWTKTRFSGHPMNRANGGFLRNKGDYVRLGRPLEEMPGSFDQTWSDAEKHQHVLEGFCSELLRRTGKFTNVIYELFNEGEWYPRKEWVIFQRHFAVFFRKRTLQPVMVNDDRSQGNEFRKDRDVQLISLHLPQWSDQVSARTVFNSFASAFDDEPRKPLVFSETVPEYQGGNEKYGAVIRLLWGTALSGTSILFQNDTSWGFDSRSKMSAMARDRDRVLDFEGHLARFLNTSELPLEKLSPLGSVASRGVCLGLAGECYVIFSEGGEQNLELDLTREGEHRYKLEWYDPRSGQFREGDTVKGGTELELKSPCEAESVVLLRRIP